MRLRIETGDKEYLLDVSGRQGRVEYTLSGDVENEGQLLVDEIASGVFSVLRGHRSHIIRVTRGNGWIEAWLNGKCLRFRISDPRDRAASAKSPSAAGPREICAPMPGKVIKLLVSEGDAVNTGTGLIVVEAMKMQNEMKSPKEGRVTRIKVDEGATVGPGEVLLVIE
jgi:acetyl/propionyl-CoA carboxylase alpha subunit